MIDESYKQIFRIVKRAAAFNGSKYMFNYHIESIAHIHIDVGDWDHIATCSSYDDALQAVIKLEHAQMVVYYPEEVMYQTGEKLK